MILFVLATLYAPLAFGATTPATRAVLDGLLVAGFLAFVGERLLRRRSLGIRPMLPVLLGTLVLLGIAFLLNPKFRYDELLGSLEPVAVAISWLPGTHDATRSGPEVRHLACLGLGLVGLAGVASRYRQRWTLLRAIAISGFVVALVGIYQKATGTDSMLWTSREYEPATFFAAFRYHGNAAAFLNLCWPASLALVLRTLRHENHSVFAKAWWVSALFFTFGALFVNTSKYGHVAAIPAALLALLVFRRNLPRVQGAADRVNRIVIAVMVIVFLAILSLLSAELMGARWEEAVERGVSGKRRLLAYETTWRMWRDAPLWGHGPGTFGLLFPYFSVRGGAELGGKWTFAHQDYMQLLVEWGLVGGGLVLALVAVALGRLWRQYRGSGGHSLTAAVALLALFLVGLHALVDFPLQIASIQVVAAVYLAFGWAHGHRLSGGNGSGAGEEDGRGSRRRRRRRRSGNREPDEHGDGAAGDFDSGAPSREAIRRVGDPPLRAT